MIHLIMYEDEIFSQISLFTRSQGIHCSSLLLSVIMLTDIVCVCLLCSAGVSVRLGYVMVTAIVKITLMKITVRRWCVNYPITCVLMTPAFVCLLRNCVMAKTTVLMAPMRNSVVRFITVTWGSVQPKMMFIECRLKLTLAGHGWST